MRRRALLLWSSLLLCACNETTLPQEPEPGARPGSFADVAVGREHSCGVTPEAELFCWGLNADGQLGDSTTTSSNVPVLVRSAGPVVQVSGGARHTCALGPGGELYCWGANDRGQLGTGDRAGRTLPVAIAAGERFAHVSAGAFHTCALSSDQRVYCWGAGDHGGTGAPATDDVLAPRAVETQIRFTTVAAGGTHTCAIDTGGIAHCWGKNERGQLGDASFFNRRAPGRPVFGEQRYRDIVAGLEHACAVTVEGRPYCWGSNAYGELGEGAPPFSDGGAVTPYPVRVELGARSITAGYNASCLVDDVFTGWCWGRGNEGQLGNGSRFDYNVPRRINTVDLSFPTPFLKVSLGLHHACALTYIRRIYCWGRGDHGQLGAGAFLYSTLPVRVIDGGEEDS